MKKSQLDGVLEVAFLEIVSLGWNDRVVDVCCAVQE
jgi:hypothetical protein